MIWRLRGAALLVVAAGLTACGVGVDTAMGPAVQSKESAIRPDARTQILTLACRTEPFCLAPGIVGPGLCMDTAGSFDVGNPIVQFTCAHFPDQQFRIDQVSLFDTTFQIVSCAGGSCNVSDVGPADVCVGANPTGVNGQAQDGDSITLMPCLDRMRVKPLNTRWRLDSSDLNQRVSHARFRSVLPSSDPAGKCIDVPGALDWLGLPLQLFHCHSGSNQQWQLTNW